MNHSDADVDGNTHYMLSRSKLCIAYFLLMGCNRKFSSLDVDQTHYCYEKENLWNC